MRFLELVEGSFTVHAILERIRGDALLDLTLTMKTEG